MAEVMEVSDLTVPTCNIFNGSTAVVDYLRFTNLASLSSFVSLSLLIL